MAKATRTQLLDSAQLLVQERGYNAFSYKDLAAAIGIRTASIHYHFPTKADLGEALMQRYREGLTQALESIDQRAETARAKLESFIELYRRTEAAGAICLCGSLATDLGTLTEAIGANVAAYLEQSEAWVAEAIEEGQRSGELAYSGDPRDAAASLISGLQGGLILARGRGGPQLDTIERVFFRTLEVA